MTRMKLMRVDIPTVLKHAGVETPGYFQWSSGPEGRRALSHPKWNSVAGRPRGRIER